MEGLVHSAAGDPGSLVGLAFVVVEGQTESLRVFDGALSLTRPDIKTTVWNEWLFVSPADKCLVRGVLRIGTLELDFDTIGWINLYFDWQHQVPLEVGRSAYRQIERLDTGDLECLRLVYDWRPTLCYRCRRKL